MVVLLNTTDRQGNKLEGHGLLIYARRQELGLSVKADSNERPEEGDPIIVTLWHVVGLSDGDPPNFKPKTTVKTPGAVNNSASVSRVIGKLPLEEIDLALAETIQPAKDGLCLLEPSVGFTPDPPSHTRLAIPLLRPNPVVGVSVTLCFNRERDQNVEVEFMNLLGYPRKRGVSDSYSHPGPPGESGPGMSGAAILPQGSRTQPPDFVFGLHCGQTIYPHPPHDYYFLGTQAITRMLRSAGYYHPIMDLREAEPRSDFVKKILKWALKRLAPT